MSVKEDGTLPAGATAASTNELPASPVDGVTEKEVRISRADKMAIRRLRGDLIEKLFTPDRTFNSWTDLKATN
ncbi:MAG TPA: hypothetical protein VFX19_06660 [Dehalococcoidia bacterium]|nr:hypothetical protein [Dehalococcoidia bacterium]